jgi:hypothetical protein
MPWSGELLRGQRSTACVVVLHESLGGVGLAARRSARVSCALEVNAVMDSRDLYGLPLERFIAERNALAKELRAGGSGDEAARIAAMRKPSLAAWAVNQLVRTQRRAVAALLDAGDALQKSQSDLIAVRGDPLALRDAGKRERASVAELVEAARGLLSSDGHELAPAMLGRVSDTLHAAALDEHARAQVQDGCLHRELRHIGFVVDEAIRSEAPRSSSAGKPRGSRKSAKVDSERRPARAERERSERQKEAHRAEAQSRRLAERADRELKRAQERRDRAADSLAGAEAALADARERADEAAAAYQRAQHALEHL